MYDAYGRVSSMTGNNHTNLGYASAESISYGYDHGDNILTETRSSAHSAGTTGYVNTRQFDAWGRLTQTSQNLNSGGDKIISQLTYTDKDQLASKRLGNGLQQVDYAYLQNGMLSSINGINPLSGTAVGVNSMIANFATPTFAATTDDLFRQELRYNTNTTAVGATSQNSGNIGQMTWQVKGRAAYNYGFTYDYLDRLTAARFSNNKTDETADPVDYYGESLNFDIRGNVTSITRNGMVKSSSSYTNSTIDNQAMTIPSSGNLTTQSTGASSIPASHINLEAPHNHLNLPTKFDFGSNNTIELLYDGLGNKLRKTVKTSGTVTLTQDYLDGIELKNNTVEAVYNEEGRAFNNGGTFRYEYVLRDHLGNTRLVFSDKNGSGTIDHTEILGETHYYPFGKAFDGAWYSDAAASKYKYLYNGKELSEEFDLNFYDYGARWLDPGLGSWWEVDPASEGNRRWSPYAYGNNNPIRFIDPDGRESQTIYDFAGNAHQVGDNDYANSAQPIELQFDQNGKFKRSVDDGKKEYSGSIVDDKDKVLKRFAFNDQKDAKNFEGGNPNSYSLDMNFSKMATHYMKEAEIYGKINILFRYPYAAVQSLAGGGMDFVQWLYKKSETEYVLYIAGNTAYNNYDAGNFLWGMAMQKLGFDYGSVKVGSEVNGFFNSKRQNGQGYGVTWEGDAVEDQKAIRKGYFWNILNK